jgi:hypothetical protein
MYSGIGLSNLTETQSAAAAAAGLTDGGSGEAAAFHGLIIRFFFSS